MFLIFGTDELFSNFSRGGFCVKLTNGYSSTGLFYDSLRTFTRALQYAAKGAHSPLCRYLYEGFCLSYLTQLNRTSQSIVKDLLVRSLFEAATRHLLSVPLTIPSGGKFVQVQGYWLPRGSLPLVDDGR